MPLSRSFGCLLVSAIAAFAGDFNANWKFSLEAAKDSEKPSFDDTSWRTLNVPHDWSIEAPYDKKLEGATGYLPGGTGWYRKHFPSPAQLDKKLVFINFDGVYNNSEVYINGTSLGFHPYGYSPFFYDITQHLRPSGEDNVVAVKVDRTRYADSRWYTGSGIYRDVELITVDRLHLPIWGTFITTPEISAETSKVHIENQVSNQQPGEQTFELKTRILDPKGALVSEQVTTSSAKKDETLTLTQDFTIPSPQLWETENPNQYTAVTSIVSGDKVLQSRETHFGIRSLKYDPNKGFFLNGKHTLIKGVCLHHDGGLVGAAVPRGVWKRRLETLKSGGCNAIRISHNPGSAEFIDLCDEMGFLVQNEFFDEWDYPKDKRLNMEEKSVDYITRGYTEHFQKWAERDLKSVVLRDRNHPSIIMWSIGNEIEWTYPQNRKATGYFDMDWSGNYFWTPPRYSPDEIRKRFEAEPKTEHMIGDTAKKLADWTRELDTTRPVIANLILPSASYVSGYADALDIIGYSYRQVVYDYGHKNFPNKMIMGTENLAQWHEWKAVIERPFIAGIFLWTGVDYLGEARNNWPEKGTASGILDFAGFEKPSFHMMKTLWSDEPHLYIATQTMEKSPFKVDDATGNVIEKKPGAWKQALWVWHPINEHWNYQPGELISVEAYSNSPEVELLLDGKSLGTKKLADFEDRILKWAVPYAPGKLTARATSTEISYTTASAPAAIILTTDHQSLTENDVAHIVAQLVDAQGNPVKHENRDITFTVEGGGTLVGVDNGAPDNVQTHNANHLTTSKGRSLLLVRANSEAAPITIKASADHIESLPLTISK